MKRILVLGDGASPPASLDPSGFSVCRYLEHRGRSAQVNLKIESPTHAMLSAVSGRAADLIRIAAYVYGADQSVSRGGTADVFGDDWEREFTVVLPVNEAEFWNLPTTKEVLQYALYFVSGDRWRFRFTRMSPEEGQVPFDLDPSQSLGSPDSLILFSGGLDSLCAVVESVTRGDRHPALVRHVPSNGIAGRQHRVIRGLKDRFQGRWPFPSIRFPTHRVGEKDAADSSQRTRTFLFAALGAVIGDRLGLPEVVLADNGVVSLNLPINRQLIGTTASRSTHPKTLRLFNALFQQVFEGRLRLVNPLWSRTRGEALDVLIGAGAESLVSLTNSCGQHRARPAGKPFCGLCSQCLDRRFATAATHLDEYDPGDRYGIDVFREGLPEGLGRTMALSYVRFALEVHEQDDYTIFRRFPELFDALDPRDPQADLVAAELGEMLRRHGAAVVRTLGQQVARYPVQLVSQTLPPTNLLRMTTASAAPAGRLIGQRPRPTEPLSVAPPVQRTEPVYAFRQTGEYWTLAYEGEVQHLPDRVGLHYLHALLQQPGQPVGV